MTDVAQVIALGSQAPDARVYDAAGSGVLLSEYWREQPVLLFFLRHFGCALCREHLQRIRAAFPDIQRRGGKVVAITFGEPHGAARFAQMNSLPFPVLADPERAAYHAFGLTDGHMDDVFDPVALLRQAAQALRGNIPYVTSLAAASQRGGVFVVDRAGFVRLAHIATPIYNYPTIEQYYTAFDTLTNS